MGTTRVKRRSGAGRPALGFDFFFYVAELILAEEDLVAHVEGR